MLKINQYKTPFKIKTVDQISFNNKGAIVKPYYVGSIKSVVVNDHNLLYFFVKKWQLAGKLGKEGITVLNFDAHKDIQRSFIKPPKVETGSIKNKLGEYLYYSAQLLEEGNFLFPLAQEGSLEKIIWASETLKKVKFKHYISINKFDLFGKLRTSLRSFSKPYYVREQLDRLLFDVDMCFVDGNNLVLSIDLDYFVIEDNYIIDHMNLLIKRRKYEQQINEGAFDRFTLCMNVLKEKIGRPLTFICSSSPMFTSARSAKYILKRLENILG